MAYKTHAPPQREHKFPIVYVQCIHSLIWNETRVTPKCEPDFCCFFFRSLNFLWNHFGNLIQTLNEPSIDIYRLAVIRIFVHRTKAEMCTRSIQNDRNSAQCCWMLVDFGCERSSNNWKKNAMYLDWTGLWNIDFGSRFHFDSFARTYGWSWHHLSVAICVTEIERKKHTHT